MKTGRGCCLGWLRPVAFVDPLLLRLALDRSSIICLYKLMIVMLVLICHSHQKPLYTYTMQVGSPGHRHNGQGMGDDDFDDEAGMVRSPMFFFLT